MNIIVKPHVLKALTNHVAPWREKEERRYYLKGMLVELHPDRTIYVATDGHILVAHYHRSGNDVDKTVQIIVPAEFIRSLKVKARQDIACFQLSDDCKTIGFNGTTVDCVDAKYPDWRRVVSADKLSGKKASYDPRLLCKLFDAIGDCEGFDKPLIRSLVPNGDRATRLTIGDTLGIIMPFREHPLSDEEQNVPDWIGSAVTTREQESVAA